MSEPPVQPSTPAVSADRPGPDPISDSNQELEQLGTRLREARLRHGLSIEHLSERLHIGLHQLQALENADRSRLPEVVFVIAQAKRVAEVLEVDVDDLIPRLRQAKAQRNPPRPETPQPPRPLPAKPTGSSWSISRSRSGLRAPVPLVLVALAVVAALALALRPRSATNSAPAPMAGAPAASRSGAAPVRASDLVLVLRAAEPSWMEVRRPGGQRLFEGTLEGERRFALGEGLEVRAGRPYAVTAAIGSRPPRPLGGVDDIAWKRFSPAGIGGAGEPPISADRPAPAP